MTSTTRSNMVDKLCELVGKHGNGHFSCECEVCREIVQLKENLTK